MLYAPFTDRQASGAKSSLFLLLYLFIFPLTPACASQQHAAHQHEDQRNASTIVDNPTNLMRWSDPATWQALGQQKPVEGDEVNIPAGTALLLDESPPQLKGMFVDGELHFAEQDLYLSADYIIVGGLLQIGSPDNPFQHKATINLTTEYTDRKTDVAMCGTKVLCAMGGKFELHGALSSPAWTRLADGHTAAVGATHITLEEPVSWRAGDQIVIVSTDFDPNQAERRQISDVSADGLVVSFEEPLNYMHWGTIMDYSGHKIDQRAEVMHLDRNIVVQGDEATDDGLFGGHVMIMSKHMHHMDPDMSEIDWQQKLDDPMFENTPDELSHISGVELTRLGQTGKMGRYPMHFHMFGDAAGAYVKNSSVHDSYQRCIAVHGTFGTLLENNVAYNSVGHCYFLESFVEKDNRLVNNIGAVMKHFPDKRLELIESDNVPSIFWVSFPTNHLIGNVAAGSYGTGIWIDLQDTGGNRHNENAKVPMGEIRDNVVHSNALGNRRSLDETGDPETEGGIGFMYEGGIGTIHNLTAYKNVFNFWADESSDFELQNATFSDAHSSMWQRRDGSFNSVFVAHTDNVGNPRTDAEFSLGRTIPQFGKSHVNLISAIMGFYSKSFSINNTFIGYQSDDIFERGVASVGGASFDAPIFFEGSTMIDSDAFVPSPAKRKRRGRAPQQGVIIIDFDGTLTGEGRYQEVRIGPKILTDEAAGCTYHDDKFDQPIFKCDTRSRRFASLNGHYVTVDGNTYGPSEANTLHMPTNRIYEVDGPLRKKYMTREGYRGEYMVLKFTDVREKPDVLPNSRRDRVTEAGSIEEVITTSTEATDHRWYYDGANNEFWLRLVTGDKAQPFGAKNRTDGVKQPFSMHYGVRIK
ncbi:MAG: G8 domain-containing protein [Bacteroidota bacterium]